MNHFSIIVTAYNCQQWIARCLETAFLQQHKNFEVIVIDAKSDDGTYEEIQRIAAANPKVPSQVHQNLTRKYQAENMLIATRASKPGSICVSLDGDDWLAHFDVLKKLDEVYTQDVWLSYGSYIHSDGSDPSSLYHRYPESVIKNNSFRKHHRWLASHLRTWRRELFLKIDPGDLTDGRGEFFKMTGDCAVMFPMLEMSAERQAFIPEVLYVYNTENQISDHRVNENLQTQTAIYIRSKDPYERLVRL